MSIRQQLMIPAQPAQVYDVLVDAAALSALCGKSGEAGRAEGDAFTAFDGFVVGRQVELVPAVRLVQAWRFPAWDAGTYSIVQFSLGAEQGGTRLVIDQHGEPADWHDHLEANWPTFYLTPLATHFPGPGVG
jgi:activator of HSP90 ATPase